MIEVHNQTELALSDSAQALTPKQYLQLVAEVRAIHDLVSLNGIALSRSKNAPADR
jgi:3-deoxy-D-arabino-heptulosonate 7-phosphate (DAHP) synthase